MHFNYLTKSSKHTLILDKFRPDLNSYVYVLNYVRRVSGYWIFLIISNSRIYHYIILSPSLTPAYFELH